MSRKCYIDKIREDILDAYGVDKTSATLLKPNKILLPVGGDTLQSKENTLEWAKRVANELYAKYNSKLFGNVVTIDNTKENGTIVDITIPTRLIDAYERKYGTQSEMFSLDPVSKKNELVSKINKGFEEYIKNNNISVEFFEHLRGDNNLDHGFHSNEYDPIAIFNVFKSTIKINEGKADITTLPEELGHHITYAMEDSILVTRALNLVNKIGIESILGNEYEQYKIAYNNNKDLLSKEALGKLISKSLVNKLEQPKELKSETGNKLWETIKRLLDKFVSLFKPNDNIMNELQKDIDELSNIILEGKYVGKGNPLDIDMFQLNKDKYKAPNNIRKQFAYYESVIIKNKKQIAKYKKEILENPKVDKERLFNNINYLKEQIVKITKALDELKVSNNKQLIIDLAEDTLEYAENYVKKLNDLDTPTINDESINHIKYTVDVLKEFAPTSKRAIDLYNNSLHPLIKKYALYNINEASGVEVTKEEQEEVTKDIFVGEKALGTLSDIKDNLGKTIGYLIKQAQNSIAQDNKKAFKEVSEEVKLLEEYVKSKGMNPKDTYKVFIQEQNGTTVLTRPYTSEFYKNINESFKDEISGKNIRKSFATWNSTLERWEPKDKTTYTNKNYTEIQNTPELKRFYEFFKNKIEEISGLLPISLNDNFIPNIVEESLMNIILSDKSLMSKLSDGIQHITDIYDIKEGNEFIFDESLYPDTVPLRYIAKVSPDKKSTDLGSSLLKFIYFANSYEHMSEVLPKTKLLLDEIKGKEYIKNTNNNILLSGESTNIYEMSRKFIDIQVLGKTKNDEKLGRIQYGKIIDFGLKYTSILRIGFNPFNATTNVAIGRIGNIIEAWGSRYFTLKDYYKAEGILFSQILKKDSKVNKIVEKINPLMELEDYENLEKVGIAYSKAERVKETAKKGIYFLQTTGEKYLQTTTMIANMLHDTIDDKEGKKYSIWEAFDEEGNWKEEQFGPLTDKMIFRMSNKVQRINQAIHGRYSAKDASIMTQYALFRIFFQFKKWIPAAFESRLQTKRYDVRLDKEIEGRWRTYYKVFKTRHLQLTYNLESMEKNGWTESDVYNMRKNIAELVTMMTVALLGFGLAEAGDDDKELKRKGWYKFTMSQLDRVSGDLTYFYNPMDMNRTFTQGMPLFKTVSDLGKAVVGFPHIFGLEGKDDIYRSGPNKGDNKGIVGIMNITPGIKPINDFRKLFKDVPYKEPVKQ